MADDIRLGIIGCGGFGLFALQQFAQVDGVTPAGMAGTHREAAKAAAARFGIEDIESIDAMVARDDIDLVYIATPPFLHHDQAIAALTAGKHVICEKPTAMSAAEADAMLAAADKGGRLMVTNLMQRYNPVFAAVRELVERKLLGEVLHGFFENYAADEGLPADHWFWDRSKSGGIFIEHGVHFFDLFEGWLGPGEVVAAQTSTRPGAPQIEDQVNCTVRYRDGILVNFYHGFTQPARLDRQEIRIVFERGDLSLYGWIPTTVRLDAIADEAQTREIVGLFKGARVDVTMPYGGAGRQARGRHKDIDVYQRFEMRCGEWDEKQHVYSGLLRDIMADQVAFLRDPSHERRVTEANGRNGLRYAVDADALARREG